MKINQYNFYFPSKLLKEVLPGEVFYFTAPCSGTPYTRIGASIDHTKFYILDIGCSEFFEPKEEDMEKRVYLIDGVFNCTMLPRPEDK